MVDIDDLKQLKMGFKQFLNNCYNHLSHKDIICSDAFYLFRQDLGVTPKEIFETTDGLERYRDKLMEHFIIKGRKNPKSDAYTYCRCVRLLKEYVNDDKVRLSVPLKQNTISASRKN